MNDFGHLCLFAGQQMVDFLRMHPQVALVIGWNKNTIALTEHFV